MKNNKAKLVTVSLEVYTRSKGYVWREGYQVITPEGKELFPHLTKSEAKRLCKEEGWKTEVV